MIRVGPGNRFAWAGSATTGAVSSRAPWIATCRNLAPARGTGRSAGSVVIRSRYPTAAVGADRPWNWNTTRSWSGYRSMRTDARRPAGPSSGNDGPVGGAALVAPVVGPVEPVAAVVAGRSRGPPRGWLGASYASLPTSAHRAAGRIAEQQTREGRGCHRPAARLPAAGTYIDGVTEPAAVDEATATDDVRPGGGPTTAGLSTVDEPAPPAGPGWRDSLRFGLVAWLGGLMACVLVTAVAWLPFEHIRDAPRNLSEAIQNWHRWDTTWYVIIAESGYRADPRSAAFFPLYPMLVRAANTVVPGDAFLASLLVSVLACLAALVVVHRLATDLMGGELGRRTAFYLIAFPTGFFLIAAYNESLFVALAVGSLYAMRRGHWWLAGLLAGFASASRVAGVLLGVVFVFEYLRQRDFAPRRVRPDLLWVALTPSGLLAYAAYCWSAFGDPLFFQKQQAVWFRDGYTAPWTPMLQALRLIQSDPLLLSPTAIRNLINLIAAIGVIVLLCLAVSGPWRLGPGSGYLVLFAAMDILLPLMSGVHSDYPLSGIWRFALECLPVFMVLAKMGSRPTVDRLFLMAGLPVQGVMILTFVQNQFVA